ncbi:MAG: amino acid adenylation domain-containing protein, partial [Anaerovibrio sp.]
YLNSPEQTAKAFIPNPFSQDAGYDRVYCTGDIVRFLPDGSVDFIGRNDGQVKVRGFRIELSEVERVIRQYPGIKDATVADFDAAGGGKFLAAYVVSDDVIDIDKLNDFILERKPPYMVPAVTMQIDSIPLNQNQKVNKRALPVSERQAEEIAAPQNEIQQRIFDCIAEVIGSREFGITTDIYKAGVTSIGAIRLNVLLAKAFDDVVIRTKDLKENNTIEKLEQFVVSADRAVAYEVYSDYPLTQTQNGVLVESMVNEGTTIYNIPYLFRLSDRVELPRLKSALEQVIEAHPYVKATLFMNEQGVVRAARNDEAAPVVELITCEKLPANEELVLPYDILGDRLYRARIYQTADGNYLFLDFHHIICDGNSEGIIIRDMNRAYAGEALEKEGYTGFEAALDEEKLRGTDAYEKAKQYYDAIFKGCDTDFLLPADRNGKEPSVGQYYYLSGLEADSLKDFCTANKVTLNAFFNSVFGFVLAKYNYKNEAVYTTIYNGRNDARLADSVVMLVKTLPVYCNTDGERKIADYMSGMQEQLVGSMANDLYSFAEIAREYNLKTDIMFAYQGDGFDFGELCGEKAESIPLALNAAKSLLAIKAVIRENQVGFIFEYRSDVYAEETMQGLSECLVQTAREFMVKNYLKEVSMLSPASEEILRGFNATEVPIAPTTCNKLFEKQAALHPDKTAVISNKEKVTYDQLNKNANRIAHCLMQAGVKPDELVGVMVPRYIHTYAARQGVLKSGGAFMPIDPKYPDDRIDYILSNSGAKLLITTEQLARERGEFLRGCGVQVCIIEEMLTCQQTDNPQPDITPQNLCYCIYTSGSTGRPKGVMIEHHCLVNGLIDFVNYNHCDVQSGKFCETWTVSLAMAALTFDLSVLDETLPLYRGATVVLATEEEIHNPLLLAQAIKENGVDLLMCTVPHLANLVNLMDIPEIEEILRQIKAFSVGSEAFPPYVYDKLREAGITAEIYNGYGPTEATITTSMYCMENNRVAIGRPLSNYKVYILDKYDNIMPPGVPGELTILGDSVGRGYVGNEKLTREKFINFLGLPAYRSGDLARWGHDGLLYFVGRMDNQVKLRGLRVELEGIASVMCTCPSVTNAVVVVKGEGERQFLCGYYVAEKEVAKAELVEHMKKSLADYMVPSALMQLDAMPLNANGKIDRKALPEPERKAENIVAPQNETQQRIFDCIAEVIGNRGFGITTDIYEAGVTSLGAIRLNALLAKAFDVAIRNQDLKENNTVEKLEQFVVSADRAVAYEVYADYPLTQTQSGVFVESVANAGTTIYNIPTLYRLGTGVDAKKLKLAVEKAIDAHPYVKATLFLNEQGEVRAARNDSAEPVVELIACDKLPSNEELILPYELLGDRLYRAQVYETGEGSYLFLEFHHIVSDGVSQSIMMENINRAYAGEELIAEDYTGFEAALDEQRLRETDAHSKAKAYYDSVFAGCETDYLPVNDRELPEPSVAYFSYESSLSVAEIEKFCADHDLTMNAFFNGAFGYVLSKYNNKDEALYTTVYNGRNDSRLSRAVTMLVKTLPVHCDTARERKIIDLLTATRDQLVGSMANDIYSFGEIARAYGIKSDILF